MQSQDKYDISILGGGIVGLGAALSLLSRFPKLRVLILEKESRLAVHQTGRNSGVIHSGVYYRPGSLKASLCVRGARALIDFCQQHRIPYQICGKLIVATHPEELPRLQELHRRAAANGVQNCSLIEGGRIKEIEPDASGIKALHVPTTGIVDYTQVTEAFAQRIQELGGIIKLQSKVLRLLKEDGRLMIVSSQGDFQSRLLVNCGGLYSDRIARSSHAKITLKIIPFRGEYYELVPEKRNLVQGLIYPVPDPRFPFLGVHLSRRIDGRVEAGPSAVLALKREGYRKSDVSLADSLEMLLFPGFWRMTSRHWKTGLYELYRSFNKRVFVRDVQRLVPAIREKNLIPSGSGVRAQAVDGGGNLLDDFRLIQSDRVIHVCNAPSPAATASLAIGEMIADAVLKKLER